MAFLSIAFVFLIAIPVTSSPAESRNPLWANDILIWDMLHNSTWAGTGLTYCTGICDCQGKMYSGCIIDSPTAGSVFRIYSSMDVGQTWEYESNLSGGSWYLTDPEMFTSIEDPPAFLTCIYAATSTTSQPKGIRFTLPDFEFDGFINPDWPSSADTLKSVEAVIHPESGDVWVFGNDSGNNIYLSRSSDNGDSWSIAELVASDATLPSAAAGPQGYVYLAFRRVSDNRVMCLSFSETSFFETEVADGGDTTAPIVASEKAGDDVLAIVYHDDNLDVRMAISYNNGAHWNISDPYAQGYYPFIDVLNYSRRCAMAFIDLNQEQIFYASALNIEDLLLEVPQPISDEGVFLHGPPVIRHGSLSSGVSLFYMNPGIDGPAPRDVWFDNSLNTQSNPEYWSTDHVFTAGPNPFSSGATVRVAFSEPQDCLIQLYSIDGRLVESLFDGSTHGEVLQLESNLPSGVYVVVLRTGESVISRRLVKL